MYISGAKWGKVENLNTKVGQMIMFMGEFNHTVDVKGRIIVPSKLREELGDQFVVTVGLDGCLFVYPLTEWELFVEQLKTLPGQAQGRKLQRYFMSLAADCEVDKQGRFLVPAKLREMAGLDKDVVFAGVINKIELWSKEKWDEINDFDNMDDVAECMSEYGLSF